MARKGRTTVYNNITSEEKMQRVNEDNLQLEEDFLDYLVSTDKAASTITQYRAVLHIFWCWNLDNNKNKPFVELNKREVTKFQNNAINAWGWSPRRIRMVKAVMRSMENYITNILDDEYPDYKKIWDKIESPINEAVRVKSIYSVGEIQDLLDALVEKKEYMKACFVSLAMNSGRRKSELARFKVAYFSGANLICGGALYKTPEKIKTKGRGQRGKLLDVFTLAKPFNPYLKMWLNERERLGIKSEWLFPKFEGQKWFDEQVPVSTIDSWARTFSKMMGSSFYFHALRHLFTSYLLDQNLPESVVQMILGWSSSDMVRIYDDRSNDSQLEKYFGDGGIKQVEQKSLNDL